MQALVTGFEPFDGDDANPSREVLAHLEHRRSPLGVSSCILPTVFGRAFSVLEDALTTLAPDIVLSLGLAGGRSALSLERVALNIDDARIADNDGNRPVDNRIVADGPAAYFTRLPIKAAAAALRKEGLPAEISNTAGTFVCNHVFYRLQHFAATRRPQMRCGFVHLPYLPSQAARHDGAPSMALADMVRGVEITLAITAGELAA